ncbi:conjugal transfer protein [Pandoraea commovens]|uniref:Conjugal transfer protein n=1 Tax=Pandoraea commovens TaxID=2508289 RepID=A0ABY5Q8R6_9BURK|nr:conjugal transfer protein [Pandoraea commovens]UVA77157.1 conjugal transfer protein [Pandoraea commovens]
MKPIPLKQLLLAAIAVCSTAIAIAEDLGIKSQTYTLDRDAAEQMKDVMRKKQANGELDRFWQDYRDRTIASIKNPASLGIKSDYTNATELRSLRFAIPSDYKDQTGRVIVKRGTIIEPLKIMPLTTGLIFIDGNDQRQVAYAIKRSQTESLKIVLTAGSPYALRVKYRDVPWHGGMGVPFYFDQRKMIINSLSMLYGIEINRVPVALSQRGDKLAIEFGMGGAN